MQSISIMHNSFISKYTVTIALFAVLFLAVGEQSLYRQWIVQMKINHLKEQRDDYLRQIEEAKQELRNLHVSDSLERFAREQYYMHTPNETVYVIE